MVVAYGGRNWRRYDLVQEKEGKGVSVAMLLSGFSGLSDNAIKGLISL